MSVQLTPGLWKNENNGINFVLVADDFGVKFYNIESLNHFTNALKQKYEIIINM